MKCPNSLCISLGAYPVTHCSIVSSVLIVLFFAKIERLSRAFMCLQMLSPIGCWWCWWGWWCWGGVYFWITHCESWHHFFSSFLPLVHEEACARQMLYLMCGCRWAVQQPFIYLFVLISACRWPHCSLAHPSFTAWGLLRFLSFNPHYWFACVFVRHQLKVMNPSLWGRRCAPISSFSAVPNIWRFLARQWLKRG